MLQQDYFLRLIEEFQQALARVLGIKEKDKKDTMIRDLYRQYVGSYDDLRNLSFEELLQYSQDQWASEQRVERLNFLAELLYTEACYKAFPLRGLLMEKAFKLYAYVDTHSDVMSIDRRRKMQHIATEIEIPPTPEI